MGETADYLNFMRQQGLCNDAGTDFVNDEWVVEWDDEDDEDEDEDEEVQGAFITVAVSEPDMFRIYLVGMMQELVKEAEEQLAAASSTSIPEGAYLTGKLEALREVEAALQEMKFTLNKACDRT